LKNDEIEKKIKFLKLFEIKQIAKKKIMNMFKGKTLKHCFEKNIGASAEIKGEKENKKKMLSNIRFFCHMCCYGMNWPSIRIK
jgi:hypothetical protein